MTTEVLAQPTQQAVDKQNTEQKSYTTDSNNNISTRSEQVEDPNVKFPLENSWSFWFYKNEKTKPWKENVKFITDVEHVEDFWGLVELF
jgi:hypothetical protein